MKTKHNSKSNPSVFQDGGWNQWLFGAERAKSATVYRFAPEVLAAIETHIGQYPPELGAMLGGSRADGEVFALHLDATAKTGFAEYSPDTAVINEVLMEWNNKGIDLMGFVHSHPRAVRSPSFADAEYAGRILEAIPSMKAMLMPIVMTRPHGGEYELLAYHATPGPSSTEVSSVTFEEDAALSPRALIAGFQKNSNKKSVAVTTPRPPSIAELSARVTDAYDIDRLQKTRAVVVGVGGSRSLVETLARCFVGELVLIDPDVSSATNVATQAAFVDDIGRPKVEALADRIREINPHVRIKTIHHRAEGLEKSAWANLFAKDGAIEHSALFLMTDSFETQAFGNRLALHFGVPSIAAGMYTRGQGCEVTFTHPDVTPACHRCALSSRYEAYLEQGYKNQTTSHGTPYPAIDMFNGLIGQVALAVMHHGSKHLYWGPMLARIGNRNLISMQLSPDFALPTVEKALTGASSNRLFTFNTAWSEQLGDHPKNDPSWRQCPDCGGHGDLIAVRGSFEHDLFEMRQHADAGIAAPTSP